MSGANVRGAAHHESVRERRNPVCCPCPNPAREPAAPALPTKSMNEHPVDGATPISTVSGLRELVAPVRSHHENWDGTGYPEGIAGEMIPLEARIIMFADTIDAMILSAPTGRVSERSRFVVNSFAREASSTILN